MAAKASNAGACPGVKLAGDNALLSVLQTQLVNN